ncbi:MAG: glycosyltransferase family 4 protein [Akkermansiaceae bacterium]|nr:glycosyltransferase family 4 protein [Akkermansiaceae bacterium]
MNLFPQPRRIAFLGDYVPRRCGIATFTHHLCEAVRARADDANCIVIAVNDRPEAYDYPPEVRFQIQQKDVDDYRTAADELNQSKADVLCVQHEFGIYGGPAGNHLLALLKEARMPVVTTLHTVLHLPDDAQRRVMEELIRHSDRLVVMARKGAEILKEIYGVPESMIDVIPHGIPDVPFQPADTFKGQFDVAGKRVLLTFGLLGPGKGIEHAIGAMPAILENHPETVYLVLGATHPHLVAREGEKYRTSLEHLAEDLGVGDHVIFYNRYVSQDDLMEFIGATDIYLTPYLNEAQITSGTLSYVSGAGRVVVSTPYWHAQELLGKGNMGTLVPFRDSGAIAIAVNGLLDDPGKMEKFRKNAYKTGRSAIWSSVAEQYLQSFERAKSDRRTVPVAVLSKAAHATRLGKFPPLRLDHVMRMTDSTGMFQHATYNVPNFHEGYCTDDNARAFILCNLLEETSLPPQKANLMMLATRYLAFLAAAIDIRSGRFRNFMSHQREWLETTGSEDSHGRAVWALGLGARRSVNEGHRRLCMELVERSLPATVHFTSPRAWAFTLIGISEFTTLVPASEEVTEIQNQLLTKLMNCWNACSAVDWPWFEDIVSYENARLSQALILVGKKSGDDAILQTGLHSLRWLAGVQKTKAGYFRPIGSNGFKQRDGEHAEFDQQPVEAQAMVSACLDAHRATKDDFWWREARRALEWFLGRNDLGIALHDPATGGCRDGLHHNRVNENQGAESTLAFQIALAEMTAAEQSLTQPTLAHA